MQAPPHAMAGTDGLGDLLGADSRPPPVDDPDEITSRNEPQSIVVDGCSSEESSDSEAGRDIESQAKTANVPATKPSADALDTYYQNLTTNPSRRYDKVTESVQSTLSDEPKQQSHATKSPVEMSGGVHTFPFPLSTVRNPAPVTSPTKALKAVEPTEISEPFPRHPAELVSHPESRKKEKPVAESTLKYQPQPLASAPPALSKDRNDFPTVPNKAKKQKFYVMLVGVSSEDKIKYGEPVSAAQGESSYHMIPLVRAPESLTVKDKDSKRKINYDGIVDVLQQQASSANDTRAGKRHRERPQGRRRIANDLMRSVTNLAPRSRRHREQRERQRRPAVPSEQSSEQSSEEGEQAEGGRVYAQRGPMASRGGHSGCTKCVIFIVATAIVTAIAIINYETYG